LKETIVLVEGFSSTRGKERLEVLAEEIKREFPEAKIVIPEYFERYGKIGKFFRRKTIQEYSQRVYEEIAFELRKETAPQIILIGYSMGGLICRYLVEKKKFLARTVILVGTPNKGIISLSLKERLLLKILKVSCVEEMKENSQFLRDLNRGPIPTNYYLIGSKKDERIPLWSAIPLEIFGESIRSRGIKVLDTDHSGLIPFIPKTRKEIENSAIPKIIEIIRKEVICE